MSSSNTVPTERKSGSNPVRKRSWNSSGYVYPAKFQPPAWSRYLEHGKGAAGMKPVEEAQ